MVTVQLDKFLAKDVAIEPLLDTHEGSLYVANNLFVEGVIFCNGMEATQAVLDSGPGGSNFIDVQRPLHVNELFVDRIHFSKAEDSDCGSLDICSSSNLPLCSGPFYDSSWVLVRATFDKVQEPVAVGNGKLLALSSPFNVAGAGALLYNGPIKPECGGNCYNVFDPLFVRVFEKTSQNVQTVTQRLHMRTGILTTTSVVEDLLHTSCDLIVCRHAPNVVLQSLRIKPVASKMTDLRFVHELSSSDDLIDIEFSNDLIYNKRISEHGIPTFSARGDHPILGRVVSMTCYVFDDPFCEALGMNAPSRRRCRGYCENSFSLKLLDPTRVTRMSMVHVVISSLDVADPYAEARRILLTLLSKETCGARGSLERLREDHVNASMALWKTSISLTPKCSATEALRGAAHAQLKSLRFALYNLYAVSRLGPRLGEDYPIMDVYGTAVAAGDLFLVSLLIELRPELASAILEYRFQHLQDSEKLATLLGFAGSKIRDVLDAERWDSSSSSTLFTSALVACNAWSLYRVTNNRDWLKNKGYRIISSLATYLTSYIETRQSTFGVSGIESERCNYFTNASVKLALRAAIEASWELCVEPDGSWIEAISGLHLPRTCHKVPLFDGGRYAACPDSTFPILEPLIVAMPQFSDPCGDDQRLLWQTILYWNQERAQTNDPMNWFLLCVSYGRLAQDDPSLIIYFEEHLAEFHRVCTGCGGEAWGNLAFRPAAAVPNVPQALYSSALDADMFKQPWPCDFTRINDPILSAMALQAVTQGIMGVKVVGGVAETRFYYDEMRVSGSITAVMPGHWDKITLTGVGKKSATNLRCLNSAPV